MPDELKIEKHVAIADKDGTLLIFGSTMYETKYIELTGLEPYQQFAIETGKSSDMEQFDNEDIIRDKTLNDVLLRITNLSRGMYNNGKKRLFFMRFTAYERGCQFALNYLSDIVKDLRNSPK